MKSKVSISRRLAKLKSLARLTKKKRQKMQITKK